jgi:PAS domain S-box-containing protein
MFSIPQREVNAETTAPSRQRLHRADGTAVEVDMTRTQILYEGEPATLGVFIERPPEPARLRGTRHRARRWAEIVEGLPDGVLYARPSGRIVFANAHFLNFTGLRLRDVLRHGWLNAILPEDRGTCREAWKKSIETGERFDVEFRVSGREGPPHWYKGIGVPLRDEAGRILHWCVLLEDVEKHKRDEAALEVNEKRFRRLFEGHLVGLLIGSPERVLEVNDVFLRMIGQTRQDFDSGRITWLSIIPPEERELARRKFEEVLAGGECPPFELTFLSKDGRRVPVLLAAMLLAREPEVRVMALMVDVAERSHVQQIKAERMKLEAVSMLAAGMAHNLNNLLTAIIGNASLLLDQHVAGNNARAYALVRDIISAGERAATLVSKLLASAGQAQLSPPATDIREAIGQEAERLETRLPANIRLHLDLPARLPAALISAEQLRQVVDGLVTNAVEAIGDREGGEIWLALRVEHIGAKAAAERFATEQLPPGDYCVLEVRDNGPGMDPATLVRIFDPFFTTKFMGRGLGLAAIAGIVRAARGAVRVRSMPGAGTVFLVFLPPAPEPEP